MKFFMVTPDKDYGQLVDDKIKIYKPGYQGGDVEIMGPAEVCAKWGIKDVEQVIDILGLMGDAVDNIPGIKGVGEKTAAKLLAEFGTLENVVANADSIKGALGEKVRAGKEDAIMSKKLATIITTVPVIFHEEDFRIKEKNKDALLEVFYELEFKTVAKRILGEEISIAGPSAAPKPDASSTLVQQDLFGNPVKEPKGKNQPGSPAGSKSKPTEVLVEVTTEIVTTEETEESEADAPSSEKNIHNTPHKYTAIEGEAAIKDFVGLMMKQPEICFDTETTNIDANLAELVGLSFSWVPGEGYYVPCPADQTETKKILQQFEPLFNNTGIKWIGQNLKYDMLMLKWYGYELKGETFDTMLAHYVIEPEGKRNMDILSAQFLGYEPVHIDELIGKKGKTQGTMRDVELEKIKDYAAEDADITLQLKNVFVPLLKEKEVEKVFNEVENPLVKVLTAMEFEGIRVDVDFLNEYSKQLEKEAKLAEENVYQEAGVRFNLASPKQLGEVLFDKLQLDPKAKKTKTGQYATGEDVLSKLAHQSKIVEDILAFRELTKLKSTM